MARSSILSSGNVGLTTQVLRVLETIGAADVLVVVGRKTPRADVDESSTLGVAGGFHVSPPLDDVVASVRVAAKSEALL
jgi:methylmalonyl-CoA mutase cobalamin-binding domain/chain